MLSDLLGPAKAIIGRPLTSPETESICKYLELLVEWNRTHRIVGSSQIEWLVRNIVLDSLLFLVVMPAGARRVLDVGSGAGVPGIPLKIIRPDLGLVMVESRRKRASFLSSAIRELALDGARVVHRRIEEISTDEIGRFDTVVARCTSAPMLLFDAVREFLTEDATVIVSGPPGNLVDRRVSLWVGVDNPVSRGKRHFAVMRSTWNREGPRRSTDD